MREIKFRAWDKKGKGFINGFNMIGFCTGQGAPRRKLQRYNVEWDIDSVIIEQFTDLKDKNGKGDEMYQGDLIIYPNKYRNAGNPIEIIWKDGAWRGLYVNNDNTKFIFILNAKEIKGAEIIGNIHQNPELIEERKNP
jgi:uncharacterized phage protein (TIGR01671 family)